MLNPQLEITGPRQIRLIDGGMPVLGPRELRIRTSHSLISAGTEGASYLGRPWLRDDGAQMPTYPTRTGYSNVGVVVEVGAQVERFAVGDRVASAGEHGQYVVVNEGAEALWQVPFGVGDEEATFTTLAATVLNGVRIGWPQLGDCVAVVGLGVLGQLACQYLRLGTPRPLVGVDLDQSRVNLALRLGSITVGINPTQIDPVRTVRDLTDGRGADIVFEVTGRTETFDLCFDLARRFGRVVALGSPRWPAPVDMMKLHLKALECLGAIVSSHPRPGEERNRWHRQANGRLFLELVAEGLVQPGELVTHRFAPEQAEQAFVTAIGEAGPALGVIFVWEQD